MSPRDVVITGIGLVSCLGEGVDAHWSAFSAPPAVPPVDSARFPPYTVHPLPEIDWSLQIAKRGDQRQMETWQRLGVYCAGLALDDAAIKNDEALCATMDMIVAAGGGERDEQVDEAFLAQSAGAADVGVLLNEKLTNDLRPTLFLAQLSNLLAGNISIVHKVTGSSRTFMGEEGAGVSAIETAAARLRAGQSTHALVGGAFQTEHPDMLLGYQLGGNLAETGWQPLWSRSGPGGGLMTGSGAAFLVLETREHAEARGCRVYAVLDSICGDQARRADGGLEAAVAAMAAPLVGDEGPMLVVSAASGARAATEAELSALGHHALRGFSGLTGHLKEAQMPFAVALAAMSIARGAAPAPLAPNERPYAGTPETVIATAIGQLRGEGVALLRKA